MTRASLLALAMLLSVPAMADTLYAVPLNQSMPPFVVPDISQAACEAIARRLPTIQQVCPFMFNNSGSSSTGMSCPIPPNTFDSVECIKEPRQ